MPLTIKKLSESETQAAFASTRGTNAVDLQEYVDALSDLQVGDAAEIVASDGLTQKQTKRRFGRAAVQLGIKLKYVVRENDGGTDALFLQVQAPKTSKNGSLGAAA